MHQKVSCLLLFLCILESLCLFLRLLVEELLVVIAREELVLLRLLFTFNREALTLGRLHVLRFYVGGSVPVELGGAPVLVARELDLGVHGTEATGAHSA